MKNRSNKFTAIGALAALTCLAAACGGGGEALPDTPEAQAYAYRQAVMDLIAAKLGPIGAMARGEMTLDETRFVESTTDLAALSQMVSEGFMPEGAIEQSRAMPEIWENWDDFQTRLREFQDAAAELAETAESGGFDAAQGLVRGVQQTCGDCHRAYRAPEDT